MKPLINKTTTALSGIVLFALACVLAGLGVAIFSLLALVAQGTICVSIIVTPFINLPEPTSHAARSTVILADTALQNWASKSRICQAFDLGKVRTLHVATPPDETSRSA